MAPTDRSKNEFLTFEWMFRIFGIDKHSPAVKEIDALVSDFCLKELPPNFSKPNSQKCGLILLDFGDSSHSGFLKYGAPSKELRDKLTYYLNHAEIYYNEDPDHVFCSLVYRINSRKHSERIYHDGWVSQPDFTPLGVRRECEATDQPPKAHTPCDLQLTNEPQAMLDDPENGGIGENTQEENQSDIGEIDPFWKNAAFNIDVKSCSSSGIGKIWVLFQQTLGKTNCQLLTKEHFQVDLLKRAILEDPDMTNVDLADKYFWSEELGQSFRLVQTDMMVLLQTFQSDEDLRTPRPWINLKLLHKNSKKRRRESMPDPSGHIVLDYASKKGSTRSCKQRQLPDIDHTSSNARESSEDVLDSWEDHSSSTDNDSDFVLPTRRTRSRPG